MFIYQTLDGCDGKQARRTGTSSALGELFDHGCDVFVTFLFALSASCVPGLIQFPYLMLALVALVIQLNYTYHWQTYVSGILYFKKCVCVCMYVWMYVWMYGFSLVVQVALLISSF